MKASKSPFARGKQTTRLFDVTPEKAEEMLSWRRSQRKLSIQHAKKLAAAMERGEWIPGASVMVFDKQGYLLDGQHRLQAVIFADTTVRFRIEFGVKSEYMYAIDTTMKPRMLADVMHMAGQPNSSLVAAAVRVIYRYMHDPEMRGGNMDLPSAMRYYTFFKERAEDIEASVKFIAGLKAGLTRLYPTGAGAGMHYIFKQVDEEIADWFFARLADGADLSKNDPVRRLREQMRKLYSRPHAPRPSERMIWALTIKAWNATMMDNEIRQLTWRTAGPNPQAFPQVYGAEEINA